MTCHYCKRPTSNDLLCGDCLIRAHCGAVAGGGHERCGMCDFHKQPRIKCYHQDPVNWDPAQHPGVVPEVAKDPPLASPPKAQAAGGAIVAPGNGTYSVSPVFKILNKQGNGVKE